MQPIPLIYKVTGIVGIVGTVYATVRQARDLFNAIVIGFFRWVYDFALMPQLQRQQTKDIRDIRGELSIDSGKSMKDVLNKAYQMIMMLRSQLRAMRQAVDYGILEISPKGQVVWVNNYLCGLLNRTPDDFLGNNWASLIAEDGRNGALRDWNDAIDFDRDLLLRLSFTRSDEIKVPVILKATRMRDDDGKTMGWQGEVRKAAA